MNLKLQVLRLMTTILLSLGAMVFGTEFKIKRQYKLSEKSMNQVLIRKNGIVEVQKLFYLNQ